ncbi:MAG: DUF2442 domain-containing protein [Methylovulum sp.]|nr:MAG: DUF2442 domain-containing protein [Methylovulum sp.]
MHALFTYRKAHTARPTLQRQHFKILGDGQGIHWPDIDEDISVEGMRHGSLPPPI